VRHRRNLCDSKRRRKKPGKSLWGGLKLQSEIRPAEEKRHQEEEEGSVADIYLPRLVRVRVRVLVGESNTCKRLAEWARVRGHTLGVSPSSNWSCSTPLSNKTPASAPSLLPGGPRVWMDNKLSIECVEKASVLVLLLLLVLVERARKRCSCLAGWLAFGFWLFGSFLGYLPRHDL
jgi:hypothetical protein